MKNSSILDPYTCSKTKHHISLRHCFRFGLGFWVGVTSVFFGFGSFATGQEQSNETPFRYHATTEPQILDPLKLNSPQGQYLTYNLFRGLYKWNENNKLQTELAEICESKNSIITCKIKDSAKWSDGSPLTASDVKASLLRHLITASPHAETLFVIKGSEEVLRSKDEKFWGVRVLSPKALEFEINGSPEVFYALLASPFFALALEGFDPSQQKFSTKFSGPYTVTSWAKRSKVQLASNPYFLDGSAFRPNVEMWIADEDVALRLFELGRLDFLRGLSPVFTPKFRSRRGFIEKENLRLDYVGLSGKLMPYPKLRRAMLLSVNYAKMAKIFYSPQRPGCIGAPKSWTDQKKACLSFEPKRAKKIYAQALKENPEIKNLKLRIQYQSSGGLSHKTAMEYLQNQWKMHLGLRVELEPLESGTFNNSLKLNSMDLFRKGLGLESPNCWSATEPFLQSSRDLGIKIADPQLASLDQSLRDPALSEKEKHRICLQALNLILDSQQILPLGPVIFRHLSNEKFSGWTLNALDQLDLSRLRRSSQKP